jgi:hypothetical protein
MRIRWRELAAAVPWRLVIVMIVLIGVGELLRFVPDEMNSSDLLHDLGRVIEIAVTLTLATTLARRADWRMSIAVTVPILVIAQFAIFASIATVQHRALPLGWLLLLVPLVAAVETGLVLALAYFMRRWLLASRRPS